MENNGGFQFQNSTNLSELINSGDYIGNYFTNTGKFYNYMVTALTMDFLNVDSTDHDALLHLEGPFLITNDMLNIDSITGTTDGNICVGNLSTNAGLFLGNFDFCDQTGSVPDVNTGTIDAGITYCTKSCEVGVPETVDTGTPVLFPNPFSTHLKINSQGYENFSLFDAAGRMIVHVDITQSETIISTESLKEGVYYYSLTNKNSEVRGKVIKN